MIKKIKKFYYKLMLNYYAFDNPNNWEKRRYYIKKLNKLESEE